MNQKAEEVRARIGALRTWMKNAGMDACLVQTADFHDSEYVGEHFKCRAYITGFTGSAGFAVITGDDAGLWTDSRYFLQAERQLEGTGVTLYRMGEPGTQTLEKHLEEKLPQGGVLGFDGRTVSESMAENLETALQTVGAKLSYADDPVGNIWTGRPEMSKDPVWILSDAVAGRTAAQKMEDVRRRMREYHADAHLITTLDDIIWLLNLRGSDVHCTPVFLSYVLLTEKGITLYVDQDKIGAEVKAYLDGLGAKVKDYAQIYEDARTLNGHRVLAERSRVNVRLWRTLDEHNAMIDAINPTSLMKAVKNEVEAENMRRCHRRDAVAEIRFIKWLKENIGKEKITEMSASDKLDGLRAQQEGNLGLSFDTISAYGENAAVVHYTATPETNKTLEARGLYLVDSGGQYKDGTTDITRTIALGELTAEEKKFYTLVLAGFLRLMNAKFREDSRGLALDYAAREAMWKYGVDYGHGTGHGVGYIGCVHERPVRVQYTTGTAPLDASNAVFRAGMVTSDEPGIYAQGRCGIRIENLLLCVDAEDTEFGHFLRFDPLTLVPVDQAPIDLQYLEDSDIEMLNSYHERVYREIAPLLTDEERQWLREATAPVRR